MDCYDELAEENGCSRECAKACIRFRAQDNYSPDEEVYLRKRWKTFFNPTESSIWRKTIIDLAFQYYISIEAASDLMYFRCEVGWTQEFEYALVEVHWDNMIPNIKELKKAHWKEPKWRK